MAFFTAPVPAEPAEGGPTPGGTADLSITVTDSADPVDAASSFIYSIEVDNAGPSPATSVEVVNVLPEGVSFNGFAGSGWLCIEAPPGTLTCSLAGSIPPQDSAPTLLLGAGAPDQGALLVDTATVTAAEADPSAPNVDGEETTVTAVADLSVSKDDGVTGAIPGLSRIEYMIMVHNAGPSDDAAASLLDLFPAELESCAWTSLASGGAAGNSAGSGSTLSETLDLPAGSSVTYTVGCDVAAAAVGTLSNTVTVSSSVADRNAANDSATDDDTVLAALDYGDAPDPLGALAGRYPTLVASDGARHVAGGPRLGLLRDSEDDGQVDAMALGDDLGDSDDEDGVDFSAVELVLGETVSLPVTVTDEGGPSVLSLWIDLDHNGSFDDPGEQVVVDQPVAAVTGSQVVQAALTVPLSAVPGTTFARARLDSVGGLGPAGLAEDGEVEDSRVVILARPVLSIDDVSQAEGGAGSLLMQFTVSRSHAQSSPAVDLATADGSALVADGDYVAISPQTLSFTAGGALTATIEVEVLGDDVLEADETFFVDLSAPVACDLVDSQGQGTLLNDDSASLSIDDVSLAEGDAGDQEFVFTMSLGGSTSDGFTVDLETVDESAEAGSDYAELMGSVVFSGFDGEQQSVTVLVSGDLDPEGDETFRLAVAGFTGAGPFPQVTGSGLGTIFEDDDLEGPIVVSVTAASEAVEQCAQLRQPFTSFELRIEDDQTAIAGAGEAANYLLVEVGPDGDFSTESCLAGAGDDLAVPLLRLEMLDVGPAEVTVELGFSSSQALVPGLYRLLVCDGLEDAVGNVLDGDLDGQPGGDFVIPAFRVDPFNRFENGHFDDCPAALDPWSVSLGAGASVMVGAAGDDDAEASPLSTSAVFVHTTADPSALGQCLPVAEDEQLMLTARSRFVPVGDTAGRLRLGCTFFAAPACAGVGLGSTTTTVPLEVEGVFTTAEAPVDTSAGALSALCSATLDNIGVLDRGFSLALDALFVGTDGLLFGDDFESGGTLEWSSSAP